MTEAMPFLQKYDITFLRPPTICKRVFVSRKDTFLRRRLCVPAKPYENCVLVCAALRVLMLSPRKLNVYVFPFSATHVRT